MGTPAKTVKRKSVQLIVRTDAHVDVAHIEGVRFCKESATRCDDVDAERWLKLYPYLTLVDSGATDGR